MHRHPHVSLARNPHHDKPTNRHHVGRQTNGQADWRSWDQHHEDDTFQDWLDVVRPRTTAVKHTCGCWIEWAPIIPEELGPERARALYMAASQWAHDVKRYPCPWHGSASGAPSTARRDGSWVRLVRAPLPMLYREWPEHGSLPAGYPFDIVAITDEREGGAA
jgi:hypothetical protein